MTVTLIYRGGIPLRGKSSEVNPVFNQSSCQKSILNSVTSVSFTTSNLRIINRTASSSPVQLEASATDNSSVKIFWN